MVNFSIYSRKCLLESNIWNFFRSSVFKRMFNFFVLCYPVHLPVISTQLHSILLSMISLTIYLPLLYLSVSTSLHAHSINTLDSPTSFHSLHHHTNAIMLLLHHSTTVLSCPRIHSKVCNLSTLKSVSTIFYKATASPPIHPPLHPLPSVYPLLHHSTSPSLYHHLPSTQDPLEPSPPTESFTLLMEQLENIPATFPRRAAEAVSVTRE